MGGKAGAAGGWKRAGWKGTPKLAGLDPETRRVGPENSQGLQELCSSRAPFVACDPGRASCKNSRKSIVPAWCWGCAWERGGCGRTRFAEGFGQGTEAGEGSACPTATAAAAAAADPASEVNFCVRSPSSPGENGERNETLMSLNTSKGKL